MKNRTILSQLAAIAFIMVVPQAALSEMRADYSNDELQVDTIKVKSKKTFKGYYTGVSPGVNWYVKPSFSTSFSDAEEFLRQDFGKSLSFGINLFHYDIGLQKNKNNLGMILGAGWSVHNYRFNHDMQLIKDDNNHTTGLIRDEKFSKNKLTISYINIPLLLEYQFPSRSCNRWMVDVGGYCGFRIGSHTKMVYSESGKKHKEKKRPDLNINPIQLGGIVQVGTKNVKFFATYGFTPLFDKNKAPEVNPIQVGITFQPF